MKSKKGFTLVELLVVIAIIGILSSVVMASLNVSRAKARDAKRIADIKSIQLALATYQDANDAYPSVIYGSPSPIGPYMSGGIVPTDPTNHAPYRYAYRTASTIVNYHLGTSLETSSPVLNDDRDQITSGGSGGGTTGWAGTINGTDSGPCVTSGDAGQFCFDVTP